MKWFKFSKIASVNPTSFFIFLFGILLLDFRLEFEPVSKVAMSALKNQSQNRLIQKLNLPFTNPGLIHSFMFILFRVAWIVG